MKKNLDNPHFYIFSNDMKWAKENLKIEIHKKVMHAAKILGLVDQLNKKPKQIKLM